MKEFHERLIELVKDDKELHDAAVRLLDSYAEMIKEQAEDRKAKREGRYPKSKQIPGLPVL